MIVFSRIELIIISHDWVLRTYWVFRLRPSLTSYYKYFKKKKKKNHKILTYMLGKNIQSGYQYTKSKYL